VVAGPSEPYRDRRTTTDRRAVARGGRRQEDRDRSDRDTVVTLLIELASLREENTLLRRAAISFGALAERLNKEVRSRRP
jgi:hypothetical protein